jgi:hypothetical protein
MAGMTKRTPKPPTTTLPASLLDDQVFETLAHEFDKFVDQIRTGNSHRYRQGWIIKRVREGSMPLRRVIELTYDRNWALDADEALRSIAAEMLARHEQPPALLQSYLVSRPRPPRGKGRRDRDTWLRDQCIAVVVAIALERWGAFIPLHRNDDTDAPGLRDIVSWICRDRGILIQGKRVEQIYRRWAEFLPVHQGWRLIKSNSAI